MPAGNNFQQESPRYSQGIRVKSSGMQPQRQCQPEYVIGVPAQPSGVSGQLHYLPQAQIEQGRRYQHQFGVFSPGRLSAGQSRPPPQTEVIDLTRTSSPEVNGKGSSNVVMPSGKAPDNFMLVHEGRGQMRVIASSAEGGAKGQIIGNVEGLGNSVLLTSRASSHARGHVMMAVSSPCGSSTLATQPSQQVRGLRIPSQTTPGTFRTVGSKRVRLDSLPQPPDHGGGPEHMAGNEASKAGVAYWEEQQCEKVGNGVAGYSRRIGDGVDAGEKFLRGNTQNTTSDNKSSGHHEGVQPTCEALSREPGICTHGNGDQGYKDMPVTNSGCSDNGMDLSAWYPKLLEIFKSCEGLSRDLIQKYKFAFINHLNRGQQNAHVMELLNLSAEGKHQDIATWMQNTVSNGQR